MELVACNQCQNQSELWLDQKSVMDYVVMDEQLMAVSGNVQVNSTAIGCTDHLMELGRVTKRGKWWCLDGFGGKVNLHIKNHYGLRFIFSQTVYISRKVESGM